MIESQSFEMNWQNIWRITVQEPLSVSFESREDALKYHRGDLKQRQDHNTKAKYMLFKRFQRLHRTGVIRTLVSRSKTTWETPSWGIPKGRLDKSDTNLLMCAVREFREETGLTKTPLTILHDQDKVPVKFIEDYIGSNGVRYILEYFIALVPTHTRVKVNLTNARQMQEIRSAMWFPFDAAIATIRSTHPEKRKVVDNTRKLVSNLKITDR